MVSIAYETSLKRLASIGPMFGAIAASYAGCDKVLVVMLFTVGMATMGFFYSSMKLNVIDLSPNYAGPSMSLVNGIGALSGVISPPIIGYLIPNVTFQNLQLYINLDSFFFLLKTSIDVIIIIGTVNWIHRETLKNALIIKMLKIQDSVVLLPYR